MQASALEAHLGYWLRAVSNHVSGAFAERLAAKGVTVAEWVLLRSLLDAPLPPSRLADIMGMTRGAITKLADKLIGAGLVVRKPSPVDGRAQILALTAKGARLTPDLAALADANDAAAFQHLSAADRKALERILKSLAAQWRLSAAPID